MLLASVLLLLAGLALSESKVHPVTPRWHTRKNDRGTDRIIGGKDANPHAYPFMVSVQAVNDELPFCGGSLLNDRYVLTAAHCMLYPKANISHIPEEVYVMLGEHDIWREDGQVKRYVDKIILHEVYPNGKSKFDSDIALLRLSEPITFNEFISPICLNLKQNLTGSRPRAIGWGQTLDSFLPEKLREVDVPVLDDFWCEDAYKKNYYAPHMVCAGTPWMANYKDICSGDSGGPLFLHEDEDKPVQIGIVSFTSARGCALLHYPSSYTRVSEFKSWIESHVEGKVCFTP